MIDQESSVSDSKDAGSHSTHALLIALVHSIALHDYFVTET
jgi:hypothetical protein